jgi:phosphate transport system substrate-binding protein
MPLRLDGGRRALVALTLLTVLVGPPAPAAATDFSGAGATFPAPVYNAWAAAYRRASGNTLFYRAVGSGGGIDQIRQRAVDFGGTDAPMTQDELRAHRLLQFPAVIGSVVVIVNLAGIGQNELRLSGDVVADIYLGRIRSWNDPRLAQMNPRLALPAIPIEPVFRADPSGTTFVFTTYLAQASDSWRTEIGAATAVRWPLGTRAAGNDGVAGMVRVRPGAIGYVENVYAAVNDLTTTRLRNADGVFVAPTSTSFRAAAAAADWTRAPNLDPSMINRPGAAAWPIVSATYILVPSDPRDAVRARVVLDFFDWAFGEQGDRVAESLHYIPLPEAVAERVRASWGGIVADGRPVWRR